MWFIATSEELSDDEDKKIDRMGELTKLTGIKTLSRLKRVFKTSVYCYEGWDFDLFFKR